MAPPTPRLLVVDDDPSILRLLTALLGEDYDVFECENGEAAVGRVEGGLSVDAAIIDVMMPGMDGFELVGWLRQHPATADIPIIMLTALGDPQHRERAKDVGASGFVTKPFDPEFLEATISLNLSMPAT